jgi:hypothetical protein
MQAGFLRIAIPVLAQFDTSLLNSGKTWKYDYHLWYQGLESPCEYLKAAFYGDQLTSRTFAPARRLGHPPAQAYLDLFSSFEVLLITTILIFSKD